MRRLKARQGQSIIEYLIIATMIVVAVIAAKGVLQGKLTELFSTAGDKVGEAASELGGL